MCCVCAGHGGQLLCCVCAGHGGQLLCCVCAGHEVSCCVVYVQVMRSVVVLCMCRSCRSETPVSEALPSEQAIELNVMESNVEESRDVREYETIDHRILKQKKHWVEENALDRGRLGKWGSRRCVYLAVVYMWAGSRRCVCLGWVWR